MRKFVILLTLLAHLGGSVAFAAPEFTEICTAHGVKFVPSDDTESSSCQVCHAVCDQSATGTPPQTLHHLSLSNASQHPFIPGTERPQITLTSSSRDPPRFT